MPDHTEIPPVLKTLGDDLLVAMRDAAARQERSPRLRVPFAGARWAPRRWAIARRPDRTRRRAISADHHRQWYQHTTAQLASRGPTGAAGPRHSWAMRRLVLGGASGVLAATVAAVLLLSAGSAPTAAQALPILATRGVPADRASLLRMLHADRASMLRLLKMLHGHANTSGASEAEGNGADLGTVHQFSVAGISGLGYVLQTYAQTTDSSTTLCVGFVSPPGATPVTSARACALTASVEQQGLVLNWAWTPGDYNFVALVPTGGSVTLTDDGATTNVPVDANGIAAGVVHDNATVSLQIGSSVQTTQLAPNARPAPRSTSRPTASAGATP